MFVEVVAMPSPSWIRSLACAQSPRSKSFQLAVCARSPTTRCGHVTCFTSPTRNSQASTPDRQTAAVMTSATWKCPVQSTVNPVKAGPTMPARFPIPFCKPVHLPTACDPASVCENAQRPELPIPQPTAATMSHPSGEWDPTEEQPRNPIAAVVHPRIIADLRTTVVVAPLLIQKSVNQPVANAEMASTE